MLIIFKYSVCWYIMHNRHWCDDNCAWANCYLLCCKTHIWDKANEWNVSTSADNEESKQIWFNVNYIITTCTVHVYYDVTFTSEYYDVIHFKDLLRNLILGISVTQIIHLRDLLRIFFHLSLYTLNYVYKHTSVYVHSLICLYIHVWWIS